MKVQQLFWMFLSLLSTSTYAQQEEKDSLPKIEVDSNRIKKNIEFYKGIQDYSKRSKLMQMLHQITFERIRPADKSDPKKQVEQREFAQHQGKIIRNIEIYPLDPFGFDEKDLNKKPSRSIDRWGNALHGRTKKFTIKGQLLIKENMPLDSVLLKESERILRSRRYIRRALITPIALEQTSDSVDIQVAVLDNWSIYVDADGSQTQGRVRVRERNFLGLGHEATGIYRQRFDHWQKNAFALGYRADNLYNSQINTIVEYDFNFDNQYHKQWVIERPFFSPYARWSGSIGLYKNRWRDEVPINDSIHRPMLKTTKFDAYASYAFPIFKKRKDRTNLIFSTRYKLLNYHERPKDYSYADLYYSNERLFLAEVLLNRVDYKQDRYIFRHGDTEDVSTGKSFALTSGILHKNQVNYPYLGASFIWANYTNKGYFGVKTEAGSLFLVDRTRQTVLRGEVTHFSNLFRMGDWHFRQFLKTHLTVGFNRRGFVKDRITLNDEHGISGFRSNFVYGTRRWVISSQTQSYSPFEWIGFRFSPFLVGDIGFIGSEHEPWFKNQVYSKIGIGFYVTNDYLMFGDFQVSFCYFPRIPGSGDHIYNFTSVRNYDFELQDLEKRIPHIIEFK
ncbi:hypothetical protein CGC56_05540 [Capnocytophaga canimorsus]|uniref:Outer membrane protein/protective antigen OMA87 n=1 Tax=Capnocytophaga canimorsus TaxID=28188 RepID=A0A250G2Q8_9FLAO|nr:hypothetical protein [Capnocytophaga canimorsus]ATA91682.1 hypothetical protein CGC56_05540 [Capnocytophaga canimorsus]